MKLISARDYLHMSQVAADLITELVSEKPDAVLGLATGSTPEGLYAELVARVRRGDLDLSQVHTFNLDEYRGVPAGHAVSYHTFMRQHLFDHVTVAGWQVPDGNAVDPEAECHRYEAAIAAAGGIDLQVLGIGRNGHIGFNEPGSPFGGGTRVVNLAADTIAANARFFESATDVPRQAVSMGIRTIMTARRLLLLASGEEKAQAVAAAVQGPVSEDMPASILQLHPDVTLVVDEAAGALLKA